MQIIMPNKLEKYLTKQYKGDKKGVMLIRLFYRRTRKKLQIQRLLKMPRKCKELGKITEIFTDGKSEITEFWAMSNLMS